jgi:hypothetical protein
MNLYNKKGDKKKSGINSIYYLAKYNEFNHIEKDRLL